MNTAIYEAYKALPYGENFLNWLKDNAILDEFITELETRFTREGRNLDYFIDRCKADAPGTYVTLSLWFEKCAKGFDFWKEWSDKWFAYAAEHKLRVHYYNFDLFYLRKASRSVDAYTLEEAEAKLKSILDGASDTYVGHSLVSTEL